MVASGDYLDVTTPQIEAGTGASSFIVTGTAPVTRASDMVTVPIKNNLYNLPLRFFVRYIRTGIKRQM